MQNLKSLWQKISKNSAHQPNRAANIKMWLIVVGIALVFFGVVVLYKNTQSTKGHTQEKVDNVEFFPIHDADFTAKDNQSALLDQQATMDTLQKTFKAQNEELRQLKSALHALTEETKNLKTPTAPTENTSTLTDDIFNHKLPKTTAEDHAPSQNNLNALGEPGQSSHEPVVDLSPRLDITEVELPEPEAVAHKRTHENYVPSGTFCQGILLGGAYAPSGASAQNDTVPIIFEITDNCHLPNGQASILKGARVTASVYGKIASDRGMVRLDNLSFIKPDNEILDIPVEGTAFDHSGKTGIRGTTLLRNGKLIRMSGISGLFSGLGEAAKAYTQTQSVSSLGTTSSIDPSKVPLYATGSGMSTAMGKISEYYIKLAEQYQPVIELNAGAIVDLVFLKGFPIEDHEKISQYTQGVFNQRDDKKNETKSPTNGLVQHMMKPFSEAQLGDEVEPFTTGASS